MKLIFGKIDILLLENLNLATSKISRHKNVFFTGFAEEILIFIKNDCNHYIYTRFRYRVELQNFKK